MAKKKQKKKKKKPSEEVIIPKPVGWLFWIICFVVLFGPMTYGGYLLSEEDRRGTLLPWIIGFSGAALIAGILSASANSLVHFRAERMMKNRRKSKS